MNTTTEFDPLFDMFLSHQDFGHGRRKHYMVLKRMIGRYVIYRRIILHDDSFRFDVGSVCPEILSDLYEYLRQESDIVAGHPELSAAFGTDTRIGKRGGNYMNSVFKELRTFFNWCISEKFISTSPFREFRICPERYGTPVYLTLDEIGRIYRTDMSSNPGLETQKDIFVFQCNIGCRVGDLLKMTRENVVDGIVEYIPSKTIKENARTVSVPLNSIAEEILGKYSGLPGNRLLPFISAQRYNDRIKEILETAGITRTATILDSVTRTEKKVPINRIASSHLARRTFIGNIYKTVKDPCLVSSLTGHVDGSTAFARYRDIDIDIKKDLVRILENRK